MKIITGFFIILTFYFIGESLSHLIGNFIPGNIIGMLLLFFSLFFKLISPDKVKDAANGLTRNMTIFFIPAGVGLMESVGLISQFWFSIIVTCTVSTVLVITVVGWVQQKLENKRSE